MSYLLFLDESGHDRRSMPYEIHGGIALRDEKIWPLVLAMEQLETACFGDHLHKYKSEIKGHKLLDKDRFEWAAQASELDDLERRKLCISFLNKGVQKKSPSKNEFTAYGQACLKMAKGIFQRLDFHEALLFAAVIPRDAKMPSGWVETEFLRKDLTFMFERFYYLLEDKDTTGLIVMDQTENQADRRFVRRLANYFKKTQNGILRSRRIVPSPVFVSSDMTYPVQAADVCIYCLNLGFRLPSFGMTEPVRKEIEENFEGWIRSLQFQCTRKDEAGFAHARWGIVYVQDPY